MLFLDEATSGLDAASALAIVQILRRLSQLRQQTIVCTLHQPRASILALFDTIGLLAEGRLVYFGPTIPNCLEFFSSAGFECPQYENPGDFLIDLVNTRFETGDADKADQSNTVNVDVEMNPDELDEKAVELTKTHFSTRKLLQNGQSATTAATFQDKKLSTREDVITYLHDHYEKSSVKVKGFFFVFFFFKFCLC